MIIIATYSVETGAIVLMAIHGWFIAVVDSLLEMGSNEQKIRDTHPDSRNIQEPLHCSHK